MKKGKWQEIIDMYKGAGVRAVIRRYGWKFFLAFFMFYLIRDFSLYILLPYLFAKKLLDY